MPAEVGLFSFFKGRVILFFFGGVHSCATGEEGGGALLHCQGLPREGAGMSTT